MTREQAAGLLARSIAALVRHDAQLLELGVSERATAFRLALYMSRSRLIRPPLTIDCEYNRHLGDRKKLNLPPRRRPNASPEPSDVFPDILVHQRNSDDHNVLVVELKKPGEAIARDETKLRAFRTQLGYMHAAHVILGKTTIGAIVREVRWVDG